MSEAASSIPRMPGSLLADDLLIESVVPKSANVLGGFPIPLDDVVPAILSDDEEAARTSLQYDRMSRNYHCEVANVVARGVCSCWDLPHGQGMDYSVVHARFDIYESLCEGIGFEFFSSARVSNPPRLCLVFD